MSINIVRGDITKFRVDVVVNAANKSLKGGGGVDGAIHRADGKELMEELKEKFPNGINTGEVAVTDSHNMPCEYIFHTAGPVYGRDDLDLLKRCYKNSLDKAEELELKSIAFPAISTGVYGVPMEESAKIVKEVMDNYEFSSIEEVYLVFLEDSDIDIYERNFNC